MQSQYLALHYCESRGKMCEYMLTLMLVNMPSKRWFVRQTAPWYILVACVTQSARRWLWYAVDRADKIVTIWTVLVMIQHQLHRSPAAMMNHVTSMPITVDASRRRTEPFLSRQSNSVALGDIEFVGETPHSNFLLPAMSVESSKQSPVWRTKNAAKLCQEDLLTFSRQR